MVLFEFCFSQSRARCLKSGVHADQMSTAESSSPTVCFSGGLKILLSALYRMYLNVGKYVAEQGDSAEDSAHR